jgi:hypothetical protein
MHVQVGGGLGSGHTTMSTPGAGASGRVRGWLATASIGTESKFWYVDAGWRFHRMRATHENVYDHAIGEARDVFGSESDARSFVEQRDVDFTGGWARIGLAFNVGRH